MGAVGRASNPAMEENSKEVDKLQILDSLCDIRLIFSNESLIAQTKVVH